MKSFVKFLACMLAVALVFTACGGGAGTAAGGKSPVKNGTYVDKVIYSISTDQTVALKDVIEGKVDLMFTSVPPVLLSGLSDEDRDKIDVYPVPTGYWSLLFNPIPNKAPYVWKTEAGEEMFNPVAIKEVRYAFNWLINRKKLVDELLLGEGSPMYTPCTVGLPGAYRYNILASKFGITETGDEQKAVNMIENAMQKASQLAENKGKLVKENGKWMYKGKPVTIKSIMRVDDPTGRLPAARYIHAQIEKAGLTVEGFERDRKTAGSLVYGGNPANYDWTMYLEGWGSGGFYVTWETPLCQMYSPFYGYMPGGGEAEFWNYSNEKLDVLGKKAAYGQYLTAEEFFSETTDMCAIGMGEAVRVYVVSQNDLFVANRGRFNSRLFYGTSDGFNGWTVRCADVKPDTDGPYKGKRVLRVLQYSAQGSLFMSEWDPVGGQGFSDSYSTAFFNAVTDNASFDNPAVGRSEFAMSTVDVANAKFAPKFVATGNKTEEGDDELAMGGDIPVPAEAVMYDTASKKWVPAESGQSVATVATGKLVDGYYWHHGEPVDLNDVRYAFAFAYEWAIQDGEGDLYYDAPLSSVTLPSLKTTKGIVFNKDGSITTYSNYFHAPIPRDTAISVGGLSVKAANPGRRTNVPWEIYEALAEMVVHGSKSGTVYNFAKDGGERGVEANVKNPDCLADLKAKLEEFVASKHIPVSLKDFINEDYALKRYKASIAFIEKYGNAYITTGPLMFEKIDPVTSSVVLANFDKYPYKSDYFPNMFKTDLTEIQYVKAPVAPSADKDAVFEATVSKYAYPEVERVPLDKGKVEGRLQLPSGGEKTYDAKAIGDGKFTITVPASDLAGLEKGVEYIMVVLTSISDEPPSANSVSFTILK
ncbi:ABC transporter substrate-binding protein [Treponema denticola]|uniref:ABC transporter substrate-binding protein n=1 Tax=Treponema denticola TaxID=158 RepID=UPI0020A4D4E5|nr:ABC transporter substrate-binding protein [Treponema denticola]UTC85554.1 ABC transporter substrate-binding protein [Treponema denticola]